MKANNSKRSKLYAAMFKIGCIGFGGGSALVPVIEREVIEEQGLLTKEEYDKDIVVASITPGALPMEIAAGVGKRCYGISGMFGSAFCMSFPGALLTLILLTVLNSVEAVVLQQISFLSVGITAFISCMLTGYIIRTIREAKEGSKRREFLTVLIVVGVVVLTIGKDIYRLFGLDISPLFALSSIQVLAMAFFVVFYTRGGFTKVNLTVSACVLLLYLACHGNMQLITNKYISSGVNIVMVVLSIWGFTKSLFKEKTKKVSAKLLGKEMTFWILFVIICSFPAIWLTRDSLEFMMKGIFSSLISFGGGDAYLIVADGLMVDSGLISEELFYGSLVPVVNLLPGSILCKTLTGIGYFVGYELNSSHIQGLIVALLGYASSVSASGFVFCLGYYIFQRFKKLNIFHLLSRMIKPIISGLLVSVMLSLLRQNVTVGTSVQFGVAGAIGTMVVFYILDLYLCWKKQWSNARVVAVSAAGSFVLCNLLQVLM